MQFVRNVVAATLLLPCACLAAYSQAQDCRPEAIEFSARLKKMPNVVGCMFDPVSKALSFYKTQISRNTQSGTQPVDQITGQYPNAGDTFYPGMSISLTVSDGIDPATKSQPKKGEPAVADISLRGGADKAGPYVPGETIEFSIYLNNAGPALATGIQISEVPTNLTIQRVYGACSEFPCSPLDLKPNVTATISMTAIIAGPGSFNNALTATSTARDPNPSNNQVELGGNADGNVPPPEKKDLSADVESSGTILTKGPYYQGDLLRFSIQVRNAGPNLARNIRIDENLVNLDLRQTSGGCKTWPCLLAPLEPSAKATIIVSAVIAREGQFENSVEIRHKGNDVKLLNNRVDILGTAEPPKPPLVLLVLCTILLIGVSTVVTEMIRRTRFRGKLNVSAHLESDTDTDVRGPLSFAAPSVQLHVELETGSARPDGAVSILREEVSND